MTATPTQVNGTKRPAVQVLGDWQPFPIVKGVIQEEAPTPEPMSLPAAAIVPTVDPVAEAEAEAIRAKAWADAEAARIEAEAKAEAIRIKAEADAERQRLANERQRMQMEEKQAAHAKKLAEIKAEQDEIDRQAAAARAKMQAEFEAEVAQLRDVATADEKWRKYAIAFAWACGIVALPVQIAAFWNPAAWWLAAAPVMLEGGAWVVQRGAASAVANRRPLWHYRTIAWLLAFIAAGINLWHGLNAFDPATAGATAFASLAGPGVWDLHEHGRIRRRDGVLTRRERKAKERAEKRAAVEEAAEKRFAAEREAYREKAIREQLAKLAADREAAFPRVWEHARNLAAGLGETTVTEAVWRRAHKDVEGTDPGDSAEAQQLRNAAARRMLDARADAPDPTVWKIASSQAASQVPPSVNKRRYSPPAVPGVRRKGDTPKFVTAARNQASIAAKQVATDTAN